MYMKMTEMSFTSKCYQAAGTASRMPALEMTTLSDCEQKCE